MIYFENTAQRAVYFHFKTFNSTELAGGKWIKRMVSLNLKEFCALLCYHKDWKRRYYLGEGSSNETSVSKRPKRSASADEDVVEESREQQQ